MRLAFVILAVLFNGALAAAEQETPRSLAERAAALVTQAERVSADDPYESERLLGEAAKIYQRLSDERSVRSAELERSLGATMLLLGDNGRAVLHLRRALRLDPTDRATRETLEEARRRVRSGVSPGVRSRLESVALWWRGYVPRSVMLGGALASWVLAWSLAIVRRVRRWERGGLSVAVLLGLSAVGLGALGSEAWFERASREGVVVEDGVMAYNGPSADLYPATFSEPVRGGVEVEMLERREGWARVRLRNGQETWLPERSIELVTPGGEG